MSVLALDTIRAMCEPTTHMADDDIRERLRMAGAKRREATQDASLARYRDLIEEALAAGMSQREVARRIGVTEAGIRKMRREASGG